MAAYPGIVLAVVAAMREELHAILSALEPDRATPTLSVAGRRFHHGRLTGIEVVVAQAGIGKVAAATTASVLLDRFDAEGLVFAGTAGGLAAQVRVGDLLIARELLQHDVDASPLFPRWEIPLTGRARFPTDRTFSDALAEAGRAVVASPPRSLDSLGLPAPRLHEGLVVSGDTFVSSARASGVLRGHHPDALGVEMEGAAVAQVCHDFGRPFAVVRTVSDRADDGAHVDFARFVAEVAAEYARDVVLGALRIMRG